MITGLLPSSVYPLKVIFFIYYNLLYLAFCFFTQHNHLIKKKILLLYKKTTAIKQHYANFYKQQ